MASLVAQADIADRARIGEGRARAGSCRSGKSGRHYECEHEEPQGTESAGRSSYVHHLRGLLVNVERYRMTEINVIHRFHSLNRERRAS